MKWSNGGLAGKWNGQEKGNNKERKKKRKKRERLKSSTMDVGHRRKVSRDSKTEQWKVQKMNRRVGLEITRRMDEARRRAPRLEQANFGAKARTFPGPNSKLK